MKQYVWLSFPLGLDAPRPPAIPRPELSNLYDVARNGAGVQILKLASHTGTHVDSPCHVIPGGVSITAYSPEEFIFVRPAVVDLPLDDEADVKPEHLEPYGACLQDSDIALFRFGRGPVRRTDADRFSKHSPGFGVEAGWWLRTRCPGLKAIGMDVPSVAVIARLDETMGVHNVLMEGDGTRFLIVEDMDLEKDLRALREVRLQPWLVVGMDSGPCSVVGVLEL